MADDAGAPPGIDGLRPVIPVAAVAAALLAIVSDSGPAIDNGLALAAALPLVAWGWWDRLPLTLVVLATCGLAVLAQRSGGLEAVLFLMSLAAMTLGVWERSTLLTVVLGLVAALTPQLAELLYDDGILTGVWFLGITLPLLLGRGVRRQMETAAELVAARQELAQQAVLDEKRRIARDVHDLVGHGLAAVLLHVTGARHVLRRDPDAADEALAEAEAVGRRSMQELRRTLSVLRAAEDNGLGVGESADADATLPAAAVAPLPGIADVAAVAAAAHSAGLDVSFQVDGGPHRVDPIVGLAVHRVVEEALANARQHAPKAVTDVHLRIGDDHVTLTVETLGPLQPPDPKDAARPRYGLVGMRERMASVGGDLDAGPTAAGWLVTARAPLSIATPSTPGTGDGGDPATVDTRGGDP